MQIAEGAVVELSRLVHLTGPKGGWAKLGAGLLRCCTAPRCEGPGGNWPGAAGGGTEASREVQDRQHGKTQRRHGQQEEKTT